MMTTKLHTTSALGAAVLALALPATGLAQDVCEVAEPMDDTRFLRRLSIDLKGAGPNYAEIQAMKTRGTVDETTIDEMLRSEDFVDTLREHHASLLWPNINETNLVPDTHILFPLELAPGEFVYVSPVRSVFMRTAGGALFTPCKNEPAEFDDNGNLVVTPLMDGGQVVAYQEGWVEVEPYWAPGTTIRVCGFDAQPNVRAVACPGPVERFPFTQPICDQFQGFADIVQAPFTGEEVACDSRLAILAPNCGCGPNLQYCATNETHQMMRQSLLDQELRILDKVVRNNEPYHQALVEKTVEFNGPVVHYLRYMSRLNFDVEGSDDPAAPTPDMDYTQINDWVPVVRSSRHAGVLTTPGYLLRFTTWRGRAHRFYNAFECSSFIPTGPLPSPQEPCSQHEDLTLRCGCDGCHKALEPMASHWGRFSEFGYRHLDDATFPTMATTVCTPPLNDVNQFIDCFRQYELDPVGEEVPFQGMLNGYVFRKPDEVEAVEQGPTRLVAQSLQSGAMSACTVSKMWTHFMRREPTLDEREKVLPDLIAGYEGSGHSIRTLVKQIVLHPAYRRMP